MSPSNMYTFRVTIVHRFTIELKSLQQGDNATSLPYLISLFNQLMFNVS